MYYRIRDFIKMISSYITPQNKIHVLNSTSEKSLVFLRYPLPQTIFLSPMYLCAFHWYLIHVEIGSSKAYSLEHPKFDINIYRFCVSDTNVSNWSVHCELLHSNENFYKWCDVRWSMNELFVLTSLWFVKFVSLNLNHLLRLIRPWYFENILTTHYSFALISI